MGRESLDFTVITVSVINADGDEVEVSEIDADEGMGNLDQEASQSLAIGMAVRKALLLVDDAEDVIVRAIAQ